MRTAGLDPSDVVVEVGPGLGSLTLALLPEVALVYAVEIDATLAAALGSTVAAHEPAHADRLRVLHRDALRLAAPDFDTPPTALVANLPYNVAVPVVLHLLAVLPSLRHGLVMVQKEVADRLTAVPGSKVYGVPSVKLAWYAEARQAGRVPPNVFWPVPNVESGLVAFTGREPPALRRPSGRDDRSRARADAGRAGARRQATPVALNCSPGVAKDGPLGAQCTDIALLGRPE